MGVSIRDLVPSKEIELSYLSQKIVAIDTYNLLYQFLTTIRSRDGSLLTDTNGRVTSHLVGLFSRTSHFLDKGIKPVFVFDGIAPTLKHLEQQRRQEIKKDALEKYKIAVEKQDMDGMKKYAARTAKLTKEMVEESKKLIEAMGLPIVQAPSEGEAQTAYMAKQGKVYAAVSQDFDSLLYGCPLLVRNLSVVGRKKATHHMGTVIVKPELIELSEVLNNLGIDLDQLIVLGILVGTDYDIGGVKGIGPKNALKLVKEHKKNFDALFKSVNWDFEHAWTEIYDTFKKMPVTDDYSLSWHAVKEDKVIQLLVEQHDFSEDRVVKSIRSLLKEKGQKQQKSLGDF